MNGAQDLGGMMGFGPVAGEPEGHVFHADWEKRALALTIASGALGEWNLDMSRHARETLHPGRVSGVELLRGLDQGAREAARSHEGWSRPRRSPLRTHSIRQSRPSRPSPPRMSADVGFGDAL